MSDNGTGGVFDAPTHCSINISNVLVTGKDEADHLQKLDLVMDRTQGIEMNLFVEYLGYRKS